MQWRRFAMRFPFPAAMNKIWSTKMMTRQKYSLTRKRAKILIKPLSSNLCLRGRPASDGTNIAIQGNDCESLLSQSTFHAAERRSKLCKARTFIVHLFFSTHAIWLFYLITQNYVGNNSSIMIHHWKLERAGVWWSIAQTIWRFPKWDFIKITKNFEVR